MNKKYYYIFLTGRFISSFGNWFVEMALPFIIYAITGSALAVAASFLLETLPILLLSPYTAYVIDHYQKRNILIICQLISAVVISICMLSSCKNVYILYIACLLFSVVGNIYTTTINTYIPEISYGLDLEFANMMDSYAGNISMVIAPVIAGWCIKYYGNIISFGIDGVTFLISMFLLMLLPKAKTKKHIEEINSTKTKVSTYAKALSSAFLHFPLLKYIIAICIAFSSCGAIFSALDAVYIAEVFDNSVDVYGYINSAWGIGMLMTGALIWCFKNRKDTTLFCLGILFMGIATVGYGLSAHIATCVLFNFIGGLSNTLYVVYFRTLIQKNTTTENRGGVFTMQSTISKVISILVVGLAGITAEIYSVRYIIVLSGIMAMLVAVLGFVIFNTHISKKEIDITQ